jgi:hypothetical protein
MNIDGPHTPETHARLREIQKWRVEEGIPMVPLRKRVSDAFGVCDRQARYLIRAAMAELMEDWDHKRPAMIAEQLCHLERVAAKAEESGQYAAAVGAYRQMARLVQIDVPAPSPSPYRNR